jgi:hypothetical protein
MAWHRTPRKNPVMENKTPKLLTEAQRQSGVVVVWAGANGSISNTRTVPYVERYSAHTGLWETPEQHLQRAAEDERRRAVN